MNKLRLLWLILALTLPAAAMADDHVLYAGGTIVTLKEGTLGVLDSTSASALTFAITATNATKLVIPYSQIESYEYSEPVAHHLGVLPAIAVGLLAHRQHKHIFRITYHDDGAAPQVAIFEVPKQMSRPLLAILQARAPQGCKPRLRCVDPNSAIAATSVY